MKFIVSYLKYNLKWALAFGICEGIMVLLMALNANPAEEILYAAAVSVFVWLLIFLLDLGHQWRHYRKLRELEYSVSYSLEHTPKPEGIMEEEYGKLLRLAFEEKLEKENELLGRQKELREYYAMWVHQIKTPISALRLLLQEKNETGERNEELEELFCTEQYVEMALQYVRLESETNDFVLEQVKLDGVIRGAIRKYARMFIHKKISLEYEGTELSVMTDEKWLSFVVEQILSNAVKYTAKGKITVSFEEVGTQNLFLVVADTGIGIKAEDLPRICEKGYTGYNGHADKRSTGIGLYLCNRILKKLGHSLTVTSREGKGTRVLIGFAVKSGEPVS